MQNTQPDRRKRKRECPQIRRRWRRMNNPATDRRDRRQTAPMNHPISNDRRHNTARRDKPRVRP